MSILAVGLIVTGSSSTLWSKWQDNQCVENCNDPDTSRHLLFEQPVWQTLQMFVGEFLCIIPLIYTLIRHRTSAYLERAPNSPLGSPTKPLVGKRLFFMWIPAICDLIGASLMHTGLLHMPASVFQMTRGALVLFVGTMSVIFLKRKLYLYQWISLFIVMMGLSLVGLRGYMIERYDKISQASLNPSDAFLAPVSVDQEATSVVLGIFFVLCAQIFTASQFVVEEKIMTHYSFSPLTGVVLEGLFGSISVLLFFPILSTQKTKVGFLDLTRGWDQITNTPAVMWAAVVSAISVGLANYFGLGLTRYAGATTRSLTDTCRTLAVWIVSLGLGWERLVFPGSLLQVIGFAGLVYGTFLYNGIVRPPAFLEPPVNENAFDAVGEEHLLPILEET